MPRGRSWAGRRSHRAGRGAAQDPRRRHPNERRPGDRRILTPRGRRGARRSAVRAAPIIVTSRLELLACERRSRSVKLLPVDPSTIFRMGLRALCWPKTPVRGLIRRSSVSAATKGRPAGLALELGARGGGVGPSPRLTATASLWRASSARTGPWSGPHPGAHGPEAMSTRRWALGPAATRSRYNRQRRSSRRSGAWASASRCSRRASPRRRRGRRARAPTSSGGTHVIRAAVGARAADLRPGHLGELQQADCRPPRHQHQDRRDPPRPHQRQAARPHQRRHRPPRLAVGDAAGRLPNPGGPRQPTARCRSSARARVAARRCPALPTFWRASGG